MKDLQCHAYIQYSGSPLRDGYSYSVLWVRNLPPPPQIVLYLEDNPAVDPSLFHVCVYVHVCIQGTNHHHLPLTII